MKIKNKQTRKNCFISTVNLGMVGGQERGKRKKKEDAATL